MVVLKSLRVAIRVDSNPVLVGLHFLGVVIVHLVLPLFHVPANYMVHNVGGVLKRSLVVVYHFIELLDVLKVLSHGVAAVDDLHDPPPIQGTSS